MVIEAKGTGRVESVKHPQDPANRYVVRLLREPDSSALAKLKEQSVKWLRRPPTPVPPPRRRQTTDIASEEVAQVVRPYN